MATPALGQPELTAELERLRAALEAERGQRAGAEREKAELLIENGRLRGVHEATASALRLLTRADEDAQAALTAIAEEAALLCDASASGVWLVMSREPRRLRLLARHGIYYDLNPGIIWSSPRYEHRVNWTYDERRTVHIPDYLAEPESDYVLQLEQHRGRWRSLLSVPLAHEESGVGNALGQAFGAIDVIRTDLRPFADEEVHRLEAFAARVSGVVQPLASLQELQHRLALQTAATRALEVIAGSSDPLDACRAIAEQVFRACDAAEVTVWEVADATLCGRATHTAAGAVDGAPDEAGLDRRTIPGRAAVDRMIVAVGDLASRRGWVNDPFDATWVERGPLSRGLTSYVAVPLLRDGEVAVVIGVGRAVGSVNLGYPTDVILLLGSQALIAIENARLLSELQASNATLKAALEQQTATAEVLRVIASSPASLEPVLAAIAENAARLSVTEAAAVYRVEGDGLALRGSYFSHRVQELVERVGLGMTLPLDRGWVAARAVLDRRTIHVADIAHADEYPVSQRLAALVGYNSLLVTPLLRDGAAVGALTVLGFGDRTFGEADVALLETFASQAVIAIENTRLFEELRERDDRRRAELERASAIQQRLLPTDVRGWPGVLEVAVRFRPAVETSGDFYDVLRLTPSAEGALPPLQIAVGDVAGKGMSAALVTALARAALHASASVPPGMVTPAGTLRTSGQRLHRDVGGGHFVACALALVEPPGLHHAGPLLRLANAAQVPVLLVREGAAQELEPPGYRLPLGAEPDGAYEDARVELRPGDVVVFSSDGLVEAPAQAQIVSGEHLPTPTAEGELFDFERLQLSAAHWSQQAGSAEAVAEGIWSDLTAWCGEASHHDDVTLLVLRVPAPAAAPGR